MLPEQMPGGAGERSAGVARNWPPLAAVSRTPSPVSRRGEDLTRARWRRSAPRWSWPASSLSRKTAAAPACGCASRQRSRARHEGADREHHADARGSRPRPSRPSGAADSGQRRDGAGRRWPLRRVEASSVASDAPHAVHALAGQPRPGLAPRGRPDAEAAGAASASMCFGRAKVLSLQWADDGRFELISSGRGRGKWKYSRSAAPARSRADAGTCRAATERTTIPQRQPIDGHSDMAAAARRSSIEASRRSRLTMRRARHASAPARPFALQMLVADHRQLDLPACPSPAPKHSGPFRTPARSSGGTRSAAAGFAQSRAGAKRAAPLRGRPFLGTRLRPAVELTARAAIVAPRRCRHATRRPHAAPHDSSPRPFFAASNEGGKK